MQFAPERIDRVKMAGFLKNGIGWKKKADKTEEMKKETEKETIVCPACGREIDRKETEKNKYVCYECGSYFRVRTKNRIRMVADKDSFEPWFEELESKNPLDFPENRLIFSSIPSVCQSTSQIRSF